MYRGPWSSLCILEGRKDGYFKRRNEQYTHTDTHEIFWHTSAHMLFFAKKNLFCSHIDPRSFSSSTLHKLQSFLHSTSYPTSRSQHKQRDRSPINGRRLQNNPFLLNHPPTPTMKDFIIRTACLMALATSSSHITSAHPVLRGSEKADEKQHPLRLLKKDTIPNPVPICAAGLCVNSTGGCDTLYSCYMDPCELVDCGKKKICQKDFCGGCNYVCVKD